MEDKGLDYAYECYFMSFFFESVSTIVSEEKDLNYKTS